MASLGTVSIDVAANLAGINRQLDDLNRRLGRLGNNTQNTQNRVNASTIAIGNAYTKMGESAVKAIGKIVSKMGELIQVGSKMAIMYETNMQQIDRLFGNSSNVITDFADQQARAMGISQNSVISYARTFGSLFKNMNKSKQETAELAKVFVRTAAVIKSNEPRFTMEQVMDKLRSGILGNTQAIDDLGIEVKIGMLKTTKAFRKFAGDKSWKDLDIKTQNQIRMFAILEQSANVFGTSISKNTNASLQVLNATLDDAKLKLGQAFLPIIQRTVPILITFAKVLVDVGEKIRLFSNYLFEIEDKEKLLSKSGDDAAGSQEGLSGEIDKAAKSASKSLAPFDKLNNMLEKVATPSGVSLETGDVLDEMGLGDDPFIGPPMPKAELSSGIKAYVDSMKDGFAEVKTEAQNNRKWLKNFWKTKIITDAEAKELMSSGGFKTYFNLWERFYSEELEDTTERLNSIDMKYDEFFGGLQQKPWSNVKMNWWTGMQNIKKQMDKSLVRMEQSVDKTVDNIKDTDWKPVGNEWGNAFDAIKTRVDGYLGGIETSAKNTTTNVQKEVEKMKLALSSVTGTPVMISPSNFSNTQSQNFTFTNDVDTGTTDIQPPRFTDAPSGLVQVENNNLPNAPIILKVELDGRNVVKGLVEPLEQEMQRKGNNMIKKSTVFPSGKGGGSGNF